MQIMENAIFNAMGMRKAWKAAFVQERRAYIRVAKFVNPSMWRLMSSHTLQRSFHSLYESFFSSGSFEVN